MALDQQGAHAEASEQERAGETDRPAADDQHRGLNGFLAHVAPSLLVGVSALASARP